MSNESVTYSLEAVLKEIKDSIKEVNQKIDTLQKDVNQRLTKLEIGQTEIKGDIKALDEKINGLTVRVAYQEFTNRGILIALVVALMVGVAKAFGFIGNP
jgi:chromosome segregation ATPase